MINCSALVEGCQSCELEGIYKDRVGHVCGPEHGQFLTLCQVRGEARRDDEEFHRLSHEPERCEKCNVVLNDRISDDKYIARLCRSGQCTEWVCPVCNHVASSVGPLDCPSCGSFARPVRIQRMRALYRAKRGRR